MDFLPAVSSAITNPGADPAYSRFGVGTLFISSVIEWAIRKGYREFDFLRGDEPYKQLWATGSTELHDVTFFDHRVKSRIAQIVRVVRKSLHNWKAALLRRGTSSADRPAPVPRQRYEFRTGIIYSVCVVRRSNHCAPAHDLLAPDRGDFLSTTSHTAANDKVPVNEMPLGASLFGIMLIGVAIGQWRLGRPIFPRRRGETHCCLCSFHLHLALYGFAVSEERNAAAWQSAIRRLAGIHDHAGNAAAGVFGGADQARDAGDRAGHVPGDAGIGQELLERSVRQGFLHLLR